MTVDTATRVSASHLARTAFLYVRQSTLLPQGSEPSPKGEAEKH